MDDLVVDSSSDRIEEEGAPDVEATGWFHDDDDEDEHLGEDDEALEEGAGVVCAVLVPPPFAETRSLVVASVLDDDGDEQEHHKHNVAASANEFVEEARPDDDTHHHDLLGSDLNELLSHDSSPLSPRATKKRKTTNGQSKRKSSDAVGGHQLSWDVMFDRLVAYKEKFGNCLVPKRFADDPRLGTWVETQRAQFKKLERVVDDHTGEERVTPNDRLTAQRLEKLNSLGFAWSVVRSRKPVDQRIVAASNDATCAAPLDGTGDLDSIEAAGKSVGVVPMSSSGWEPMFQRLAAFKAAHGHCNVPKGYPDDPQLARWVERVRTVGSKASVEIVAKGGSEGQHNEEMNDPVPATDDNLESNGSVDIMLAATAADGHENSSGMPYAYDSGKSTNDALRITAERKEDLNALGFVWSLKRKRFEDHWDEMFRQLCEYKKANGDCLVPTRYEQNPKLAKWVETQRYTYSKLHQLPSAGTGLGGSAAVEVGRPRGARLTQRRISRLNEIGFEWKVKNKMKQFHTKRWDEMFERLRSYREIYGDCLVPKKYAPDQQLATWVHTQRMQQRKSSAARRSSEQGVLDETEDFGEVSDGLSAERRQRLDDIGFSWTARSEERPAARTKPPLRTSYDDQWDAMFERLEQYKQRHGDCLVPKRYQEDPKLGTWCDTQRVAYKKRRKLQTIEDTSASASSATELQRSEFHSERGTIGRLSDERIRRLEELGFVWSVRDDWETHYEELKQFKAEHGHCNVPARYERNRKLGIFVSAQRSQYKALQGMLATNRALDSSQSTLTRERIRLLNDIGFAWTVRSKYLIGESWNQKLNELKFYREIHGHCNVPARCPENPGLGIWVGTQRTQYRLYMSAVEKGKNPQEVSSMTEERIRNLEEVGFVWALRGDGKLLDSLANGFEYDFDAAMAARDVYPLHDD